MLGEKTEPIFRFSLATLLLVLTWAALVCMALTVPSRIWSAVIASVSIFSLMTAILAAIYQSGHSRAFAVGFAVFGGCYLLWLNHVESYSPALLGRTFGEDSFKVVHKSEWTSVAGGMRPQNQIMAVGAHRDRYIEIMQSATIMLVAILGGFAGRYLSLKVSQRDRDNTAQLPETRK